MPQAVFFFGEFVHPVSVSFIFTMKEGIQYLSLFHVLCNQVPALFSSGPAFSLVFLLLHMYLQRPFLSLISLARFNSTCALAFLSSTLHDQTMSLYSSLVTLSI